MAKLLPLPRRPPAADNHRHTRAGGVIKHLRWASTCTWRAHGVLAPAMARHLARVRLLLAHILYSYRRLQMHLKRSHDCMLRTCLLLRPRTVPEVDEAERLDKQRLQKLRDGSWNTYDTAAPARVPLGPQALTADEGIGECGAVLDLGTLSRLYRPDPTFHEWIRSAVEARSAEGSAASFWAFRQNSNLHDDGHAVPDLQSEGRRTE